MREKFEKRLKNIFNSQEFVERIREFLTDDVVDRLYYCPQELIIEMLSEQFKENDIVEEWIYLFLLGDADIHVKEYVVGECLIKFNDKLYFITDEKEFCDFLFENYELK